MKKRIFYVAAAALALLATACSKENDEAASQTEVRSIPITLTANYGNGSKVSYTDDGNGNVTSTWDAEDKIIVCYDGYTSELALQSGSTTATATFSGNINYSGDHAPEATTLLVCYVKDKNVTNSEVTVDGTGTYHYTDNVFKGQDGTLGGAAKLNLYYGAAFYGDGEHITCNFSVNTSLMKFTLTNIGSDQGEDATLSYMSGSTEMAKASFSVANADNNTVWLSIPAGAYSGVQKLVYTCGGNTKEHVLSTDHANFVAGRTYSKSVGFIIPPTVMTGEAVATSSTRATSQVTLTDAGSETVTEIGICWGASDNPVVGSGNFAAAGSWTPNVPSSINITGLTANMTYYVRGYAKVGDDYYYAASSVNFETPAAPTVPTGAINGLFSVSSTKKVYFSKGNLVYNPSGSGETQWYFHTNQHDRVHTSNGTYSTGTITDLLCWGATGLNSLDPAATTGLTGNSVLSGDNDWGTAYNNANGTSGWRTLSQTEWNHLFNVRDGHDDKYGSATVKDVHGVVILPDNWTLPSGLTFNSGMGGWNNNNYDTENWAAMEAAGAVFLPAAGYRDGTNVFNVGDGGYYWSSTPINNYDVVAYNVYFFDDELHAVGYLNRCYGQSVRLVQDK